MTNAEPNTATKAIDTVAQLRQRLAARKVESLGVPTPEMTGNTIEPVATAPLQAEPQSEQPRPSTTVAKRTERKPAPVVEEFQGPQVQISARVAPEVRARWQGFAAQRTVALKNKGSTDRVTVQDLMVEAMDEWERKHGGSQRGTPGQP